MCKPRIRQLVLTRLEKHEILLKGDYSKTIQATEYLLIQTNLFGAHNTLCKGGLK